MGKYKPYSQADLYQIIHDTRSIADRPYMLYAAYMLSELKDAVEPDEAENGWSVDDIWGCTLPKKTFETIAQDVYEQFVFCLDNDERIDIWGKPYSIRNGRKCDRSRLKDTIDFELEDGQYTISRYGVIDVGNEVFSKDELLDNKLFLKRVVMLAEDDEHDGWDKLTDMEVAVYLWALFVRKTQQFQEHTDNLDRTLYARFRSKYKSDLYTTKEDEIACWNTKSAAEEKPGTIYLFCANKVRKWNMKHNQRSYVGDVDEKAADDYWYRNFFCPF